MSVEMERPVGNAADKRFAQIVTMFMALINGPFDGTGVMCSETPGGTGSCRRAVKAGGEVNLRWMR